MKAIKLHAVVDRHRRLVIEVPEEIAEGPVELILLGQEGSMAQAARLAAHLDALMGLPDGQTQSQLDEGIDNERAAWD